METERGIATPNTGGESPAGYDASNVEALDDGYEPPRVETLESTYGPTATAAGAPSNIDEAAPRNL